MAAHLTGPASYYRPKDSRPITLNLTAEGRRLLDDIAERTGASRADVVENLLRRFGQQVEFEEPSS